MADQPWFFYVLYYLGAGADGPNGEAMALWAAAEGMPAWENNWLATTLPMPGSHAVNGAGVQAYPDTATGVEAIVSTLLYSPPSYGYGAIVAAFRSNGGLQLIWEAINNRQWCSGCSNGRYPATLADAIGVGPPAPLAAPSGDSGTAGLDATTSGWERFRAWNSAGASWVYAAAMNAKAGIDQH